MVRDAECVSGARLAAPASWNADIAVNWGCLAAAGRTRRRTAGVRAVSWQLSKLSEIRERRDGPRPRVPRSLRHDEQRLDVLVRFGHLPQRRRGLRLRVRLRGARREPAARAPRRHRRLSAPAHTAFMPFPTSCATQGPETGIFVMPPRQCVGDVRFRESVSMGRAQLRPAEVEKLIIELGQIFRGNRYHLLQRNCNHFTAAFVHALTGKRAPGWINRLAGFAGQCSGRHRQPWCGWCTPCGCRGAPCCCPRCCRPRRSGTPLPSAVHVAPAARASHSDADRGLDDVRLRVTRGRGAAHPGGAVVVRRPPQEASRIGPIRRHGRLRVPVEPGALPTGRGQRIGRAYPGAALFYHPPFPERYSFALLPWARSHHARARHPTCRASAKC